MFPFLLIAVLLVWPCVIRLGGPGLVLLGLADNSVVPLTGSMDVFTLWLAAHHRNLWAYYAFMATAGAVLGGYTTYSLARKGGKSAIEYKLNANQARKIFRRFERWGFWTVALSAILPPPVPIVPVLVAAGALQYSRKKFVSALALGRGFRYSLVAGFGSLYGERIEAFFTRYYKPALLILIGLAALGGIFTLIRQLHLRHRRERPEEAVPRRRAASTPH